MEKAGCTSIMEQNDEDSYQVAVRFVKLQGVSEAFRFSQYAERVRIMGRP